MGRALVLERPAKLNFLMPNEDEKCTKPDELSTISKESTAISTDTMKKTKGNKTIVIVDKLPKVRHTTAANIKLFFEDHASCQATGEPKHKPKKHAIADKQPEEDIPHMTASSCSLLITKRAKQQVYLQTIQISMLLPARQQKDIQRKRM